MSFITFDYATIVVTIDSETISGSGYPGIKAYQHRQTSFRRGSSAVNGLNNGGERRIGYIK